jgi:hypothetical protein
MKIKSILVFSILLFNQIAEGNYAVKDTLNVLAMNGLNIRLANNGSSGIIGQVKYGGSVIIQDVFDFAYKDTIDNRAGNWIKIKYKGIIGFIFDGYLSKFPVPKLSKDRENTYERLHDYINSNFQRIKEPITIIEPWFDLDGKDGESFEVSIWTNNLKMKETGGYEWFEYKLYFEKTRFAEIISLFEIFISTDKEYKTVYNEAIKNYKPSKNLLTKSRQNSEIEVLSFVLTDGIISKTISFSGGG